MARIRSVTGHVHAVQELRRSNAAGPHTTRPTRAESLAVALADYDDTRTVDTVSAEDD